MTKVTAEREGFSPHPLLSTASLINHLFSLYGTLCYPVEPLFLGHLPYCTVLRIGMKSLNFPGPPGDGHGVLRRETWYSGAGSENARPAGNAQTACQPDPGLRIQTAGNRFV